MKSKTILTLIAASLTLSLSACAGMSRHDADTVGGAALGGVAGAALTGGSALGTVGGAAVGGLVGNSMGSDHRR